MLLKIQCLMLLLAVVLFKTSECWESEETFQQEDNTEDYDGFVDPLLLKASRNSSAWPFGHYGRRLFNHTFQSKIIEHLRTRHYAEVEKELLGEYASPISSTDNPTSTSTYLKETTPETSTELQTEPTTELSTEQLATETTTESRRVDVIQSTQSLHVSESSTKPTTTTIEPLPDRVYKNPNDIDFSTFEKYVKQRRMGLAGLGPMPKPFAFTEYEDTDLEETMPIDEKLDEDLVVGEIFDVPVILKIEIRYNSTYKFYVPHHAVISSDEEYNGKRVRITWANPNANNNTIVFGRAQYNHLCYFIIAQDELGSYQLTEPLMNIDDEIKLSYCITVKITTVHNGTSLQHIYRNLIGCPVLRGSPLGLFVICFIGPLTFLAFFILRAYTNDLLY